MNPNLNYNVILLHSFFISILYFLIKFQFSSFKEYLKDLDMFVIRKGRQVFYFKLVCVYNKDKLQKNIVFNIGDFTFRMIFKKVLFCLIIIHC